MSEGIPGQTLVVRKPRFDLNGIAAVWDQTGPHKTSIVNAFSFVAPIFERAACLTVRDALPHIKDRTLRDNARLFVQQEAQHSKVHSDLNEYLFENGLKNLRPEIDGLLASAEANFNRLKDRPRLATVAAGEHIIACFSCWVLDSRFNRSMHPVMRSLYIWHSLEEVEHASISFDIFTDLYGSTVSSYFSRVFGYIRAIRYVMGCLLTIYLRVAGTLRHDGPGHKETFGGSIRRRLMIIRTAIAKSPPFLFYFLPFFHPTKLIPRGFAASKPTYEAMLKPYIQDRSKAPAK